MTKDEVVKRTKNWRAELVQLYKENKEWDTLLNDVDTVNKEDDDKVYESGNCGEPWKNYKDEKYITNKELEIALWKKFEENTVWDFSYLKLGLNKRNFFPYVLSMW